MSAPRLVLERMMHRQSIAVPGESIASYALLKVVPAGDGRRQRPADPRPVLDISGSMYGEDGTGKSRLDRVRDAATAAVAKLKPTDRLALDRLRQRRRGRPAAYACLRSRDRSPTRFAGSTGSTSIRPAPRWTRASPRPSRPDRRPDEAGRLLQVVVLTDGETSGEPTCRELARQAWEKKIHFTVMGVGTEWNSASSRTWPRRATATGTTSTSTRPTRPCGVFLAEFDRLAAGVPQRQDGTSGR